MELREYLKIFKENIRTFIFVMILVLAAGFTYFYSKPVSYDTSLSFNITQKGVEATTDYKYDHFYQLSANEKFADTMVEWLKAPGFVENIYANSNIPTHSFSLKKLTKLFKAEKRSSQLVLVYFSAPNEEIAKNISNSVKKEVQKNMESLNLSQKDPNWFEVLSAEPLIIKHTFDFWWVFSGLFFGGFFLAFWTVLTTHYFKKPSE